MNRALIFWLATLCLFAGGTVLWIGVHKITDADQSSGNQGGIVVTDGPPLTGFTLTERTGRRFDSSSLTGKVWVASFFFTSCPQRCVQQNTAIKELHREFRDQGVTVVSISCDPERDTPLRLAEYAERFQADPESWLFLTGNFDLIQRIGEDMFDVSVEPLGHTERLILIDREGKIRGLFHWEDSQQMTKMREQLRIVLDEPSAEVLTEREVIGTAEG